MKEQPNPVANGKSGPTDGPLLKVLVDTAEAREKQRSIWMTAFLNCEHDKCVGGNDSPVLCVPNCLNATDIPDDHQISPCVFRAFRRLGRSPGPGKKCKAHDSRNKKSENFPAFEAPGGPHPTLLSPHRLGEDKRLPLPRRSLPLGAEYVEPQTLKFIPRITTGLSAFTGRASRISLVPAYVGIACNVLAIVAPLVAILERRLDETISARIQMGGGLILA